MKSLYMSHILSLILIAYLLIGMFTLTCTVSISHDSATIYVVKRLVKEDVFSIIENTAYYLNKEFGYNINVNKFSVEELTAQVFDIDRMKLEKQCVGYKLSYTETYKYDEVSSIERTYLFYIDIDTLKFTVIESGRSIGLNSSLSNEEARSIADRVLDELSVLEGIPLDSVELRFVNVVEASKEYVNGSWTTLSKSVLYRLYINGMLINTYYVTVSSDGVVVDLAIPFIRVVDVKKIHYTIESSEPEAILASAIESTPPGVSRNIVVSALDDESKRIYYNGTLYTRVYSSTNDQLVLIPTHIYYIINNRVWKVNVLVNNEGEYIIGTVSSSIAIGLNNKGTSFGLEISSEKITSYLNRGENYNLQFYTIVAFAIALILLVVFIVYRYTRSRSG